LSFGLFYDLACCSWTSNDLNQDAVSQAVRK